MTTDHDTDTSEDDSLIAQANEQLERELLQSQKPILATYRAPRRVVPLGISPSYVKDWIPANAIREMYQNWYVLTDILLWTSADLRRKDAIMERFELDRQRFQPLLEDHSGCLSVIVPERNLADRPA
jgi:hypothetical protein